MHTLFYLYGNLQHILIWIFFCNFIYQKFLISISTKLQSMFIYIPEYFPVKGICMTIIGKLRAKNIMSGGFGIIIGILILGQPAVIFYGLVRKRCF